MKISKEVNIFKPCQMHSPIKDYSSIYRQYSFPNQESAAGNNGKSGLVSFITSLTST